VNNFGTAQTITQLTLGTKDAKPVFLGVNGAATGSGDAINDALACGVVKINMGEGALAAYSSGCESASGGDPRTTLRTAAESWSVRLFLFELDLFLDSPSRVVSLALARSLFVTSLTLRSPYRSIAGESTY